MLFISLFVPNHRVIQVSRNTFSTSSSSLLTLLLLATPTPFSVDLSPPLPSHSSPQLPAEYQEAFALFDKKGTGRVPRESLGELLRSLGQNPTQAEVAGLGGKIGPTCESK